MPRLEPCHLASRNDEFTSSCATRGWRVPDLGVVGSSAVVHLQNGFCGSWALFLLRIWLCRLGTGRKVYRRFYTVSSVGKLSIPDQHGGRAGGLANDERLPSGQISTVALDPALTFRPSGLDPMTQVDGLTRTPGVIEERGVVVPVYHRCGGIRTNGVPTYPRSRLHGGSHLGSPSAGMKISAVASSPVVASRSAMPGESEVSAFLRCRPVSPFVRGGRSLPDGIARRLVPACRKPPRVSPGLSGSGALHAASDGLIWPKDGYASIAYAATAAASYFPPPQAALHREAK